MKVGFTLFEARKVAAPTDALARFDLMLGATAPTLMPCPPALPTPGPLRVLRELRWRITA